MKLLAVRALESFLAGAEREGPVRAHLHVVVAGLQRFVVEGVALAAGLPRRPDQRLVRVGETAAAKIGHRVRLAPDHVVEDPEAEVLQNRADAENVVIGADNPQRRCGLHHPPAGDEPGAGEIVVGGEARELVPVVIDRVDAQIIRPLEVALQLQVIGRVGEDEVDRLRRQPCHAGDAVADQNSAGFDGF